MRKLLVLKRDKEDALKQKIEEVEVEGEVKLKTLQNLVGGFIEFPRFSKKLYDAKIDMICNEEGKLISSLKPSLAVIKGERVLDMVVGDVVFASFDNYGNTVGLTESQITTVRDMLTNGYLTLNNERLEVKALHI